MREKANGLVIFSRKQLQIHDEYRKVRRWRMVRLGPQIYYICRITSTTVWLRPIKEGK